MLIRGSEAYVMTDQETVAHLRAWCAKDSYHNWEWPTDACGYEQSIRFAAYRNKHWDGGGDYRAFVLAYADELERGL